MATITEYRQQHPEFNAMSDEALGDVLFKTYYAPKGMPRSEFDTKFGLSQRMSDVGDVAASLGTGVVEGAHAVPGMLGDLFGFGMQAGRALDKASSYIFPHEVPSMEQVAANNPLQPITTQAMESYTGFDKAKHVPQTTAGEFARTIGQFATPVAGATAVSKAATLPQKLMTVAKVGVAPAVVTEGAGQAARQVAPGMEDAVRILTGIGSGGMMAFLSRPTNAAAVIKRAMPGATNNDIMQADAIVAEARRRGAMVTWPEAIAQATNGRVDITGLQQIVERTRGGAPIMSEAMEQRPAQTQAAMGDAMADISAGGQRVPPAVAGQTVQRSAEASINDIRQRINAAAEPYYNAAANTRVTPSPIMRDPLYQEALRAVRADPIHSRVIQGLPDDSVGVLNEIKKYFGRQAERAGARPDKLAATTYGGLERDTRGAAVASSRDYERALGIETDLRQRFLNPAESGPLGALSRTDRLIEQGRAVINRTDEGSEHAVREAIGAVAQRSPDAALQLVRTHIRGAFDAASGGLNQEWRGGNFAKAILGNPQEARNLEAAIRALPDGDARWRGFQAFLDVMEATGRRQTHGAQTAFKQEAIKEMGGNNVVVGTARTVRSLGGSLLFDMYDRLKRGQISEEMARIFTDPRSGPMLRNLANARTASGRATNAALLATYFGTTAGNQTATTSGQPLDVTIRGGESRGVNLQPVRDQGG